MKMAMIFGRFGLPGKITRKTLVKNDIKMLIHHSILHYGDTYILYYNHVYIKNRDLIGGRYVAGVLV